MNWSDEAGAGKFYQNFAIGLVESAAVSAGPGSNTATMTDQQDG